MSVTLANLETETYSGMMLHEYQANDIFGSRGMIYHGMTPTDKINQPIVTPGLAINKDDDADHTTIQTASIDAAEIPLELPIKASNTIKYRSVDERPDLGYIGELGISHGKSVAEGKSLRLLNLLAQRAFANNNYVDVDEDASDGTAPDKVKNGIKRIATEMAADAVPPSGLHGVLNPSAFFNLTDSSGVISSDYSQGQNRRNEFNSQSTIQYLMWQLRLCPIAFGVDWTDTDYAGLALPDAMETDMRRVIGVFWHERAWGLREQTQPTGTVTQESHIQVWMQLTRQEIGAKVFLPEGVWIMRQAA